NASRAVQGLGGAMMQATAAALVTTLIRPERRRFSLGILLSILGIGPTLGPCIGGVMLSTVGWRPVFWINIPICLAGVVGCLLLWKHSVFNKRVRLDIPGSLMLGFSVFVLLHILEVCGDQQGVNTFLWCGIFFAFIICFLIWETRYSSPILDFTLLRQPQVFAAMQAVVCVSVSIAVIFIVPPFLLQKIHHLSSWQTGSICLAAPLGIVTTSGVSGKLIARHGASRLMVLGQGVMCIACFRLSDMSANLAMLFALLFLYGIGYGIYQTPNLDLLMASVPPEFQGTIGAVQRMLLNLGNVFGAAVCGLLLGSLWQHTGTGFNAVSAAWLFAACTLVLTMMIMLVSQWIGRAPRVTTSNNRREWYEERRGN
ncbi:MAG: MFS transporter, partial [Verrucomicrobia bacterium]|nr:MFS transporter [Verrucomicrobiota bacterium]